MSTINYVVRKGKEKQDGTYPVEWRYTNDSKSAYRSSGIYVNKEEVDFKNRRNPIRNKRLTNIFDEQLKEKRLKVAQIAHGHNRHISPGALAEQIEASEKSKNLDFFDYFYNTWVKEKEGELRSLYLYVSCVNRFRRFIEETTKSKRLLVLNFDSKVMFAFEKTLADTHKVKVSYRQYIARIYEDMRTAYNNYDENIIVIPDKLQDWRKRKKKIKADMPDKDKRTLTTDDIRRIANMTFDEYDLQKRKPMVEARDVFLLSFCLMGINSRDLWLITDYVDGKIIYRRAKTGVKSEVKIPKQLTALFEQYRDKKGKFVFNFYERTKTQAAYFQRISRGLEMLAKELGIERFTFYSARHTMATIAVNELHIDPFIVDKMLAHSEEKLKVLMNHYVQDDFKTPNETNEQLMNYVFGDSIIKTYDY